MMKELGVSASGVGSGRVGQEGRGGRCWVYAVAVVVGLVLCVGPSPPARAADVCANGVQRTENSSGELPDCRAYEMVTSPYKEGFGLDPRGFTDEGIVSYISTGVFAGNSAPAGAAVLYHAERSAEGWITTAPGPPGTIYETPSASSAAGESDDLRSSLWTMHGSQESPGASYDIYRRDSGGDFVYVGAGGGVPFVSGWSADLSHVVFNHGEVHDVLLEYVGTGNDGPPRTVSIDNHGNPTQACLDNVSKDGRVIAFTSGCSDPTQFQRLWARVAGSATIAVSGSECTRTSGDLRGPCNEPSAATYAGAADDGSRVFFTTSQQLVNGDTDQTSDLYACDIPPGSPMPAGAANPCATLTEVSGSASDAQVESVVAISGDGSRVYFVAQGVLAENLGVGESTPDVGPGAHNLYLWERDAGHPAGHTRFVAGLDADDLAKAQMTPDGRYLVFSTRSALVASDSGDGGARDVYRYDAVTGALVRVSTSVSGVGGNAIGFDSDLGGGTSGVHASMTADGGSIVFDTAEALSPVDTDGVSDVYVWRDGKVSLISRGGGSLLWISPSGRDIFFLTDVALVSGDRDVIADIYDARVGGGFDVAQVRSCSGDGCQGGVSGAPGLLGPSGPRSGSREPAQAAPTLSLGAVSAVQRRRLAATGRIGLAITTNAAGTIAVRASASIGGRAVTVGSARRSVVGAGRLVVSLVLSRKARAQLAARGRLAIKVTVSHSKVALDRSVTLRLTHAKTRAKAKASAGGRRSVVRGDREQS